MRRSEFPIALLAVAAFVTTAGSAAAFTPVGSLLFEDTYNYGSVAGDLNVNINSPTRVAGPMAGMVSYDMAHLAGYTDIDGPNLKMDLSQAGDPGPTARIGLTKDFNNALASGGLTVCVNVMAQAGAAGIVVGSNTSNIADIGVPAPDSWVNHPAYYGFLFDGAYGLAATTYGTIGDGTLWQANALGGAYTGFHELAMVFTDATDNNPFNGSGTITADVYIDGGLWCSASGPDFTHNYIGFEQQSSAHASYSDLRIYGNAAAVPEPGTFALLAIAVLGFAFLRRR